MSHFIVSRNEEERDIQAPAPSDRPHLSVRIGRMSLLQYGFTVDPGEGKTEHFHPERVILLVLNNHEHVRYDLMGNGSSDAGTNAPREDRVVLIGPWKTADAVPPELGPDYIFRYEPKGRGARPGRRWLRAMYDDGHSDEPGAWNDALVYYDGSNGSRYLYDYVPRSGSQEIDDYRFFLPDGVDYWAYEWIAPASKPKPLLGGKPITGASAGSGGGSQQSGGADPYPPK